MMIEKIHLPRLLIAGANSGCGKTSITCGILWALCHEGYRVQPYKCGPDYIDPMLHSHITGRDCRNLDPFFSGAEDLCCLLAKDSADADITVAEGVMGYYDGIGTGWEGSTYTVSETTRTPTILVINVKGMARTMIPLIKGLISYRDNPVKGVILNRCSKGLYDLMKPEIEAECGVKVCGYFPYKEGVSIGSRHLGLMTAAEIENLDQVVSALGRTAMESVDLGLLREIAGKAPDLPRAVRPTVPVRVRARIALARDKAFCFYYKENLDILEECGAELVPFSPVNDPALPDDVDGVYLGGGYPESYRKELSENTSMIASIRKAHEEGRPVFAECGGFMYMAECLRETDGSSMPMTGLVPTGVTMTSRLSMQFGYVTLTAKRDTPYFDRGTQIRLHEFHYSKADRRGDACTLTRASGKTWEGIYSIRNLLAGYPHFYFHNCREVADRFVSLAAACREREKE